VPDIDTYDTSNYEKDNNLFSIIKIKINTLGKFKDDLVGEILSEFVGVKTALWVRTKKRYSMKIYL